MYFSYNHGEFERLMIFKTRKERRSFLRAVKLSTSYMIYKEQKYKGLIATYDNIVSDNEGHNDSESDTDSFKEPRPAQYAAGSNLATENPSL